MNLIFICIGFCILKISSTSILINKLKNINYYEYNQNVQRNDNILPNPWFFLNHRPFRVLVPPRYPIYTPKIKYILPPIQNFTKNNATDLNDLKIKECLNEENDKIDINVKKPITYEKVQFYYPSTGYSYSWSSEKLIPKNEFDVNNNQKLNIDSKNKTFENSENISPNPLDNHPFVSNGINLSPLPTISEESSNNMQKNESSNDLSKEMLDDILIGYAYALSNTDNFQARILNQSLMRELESLFNKNKFKIDQNSINLVPADTIPIISDTSNDNSTQQLFISNGINPSPVSNNDFKQDLRINETTSENSQLIQDSTTSNQNEASNISDKIDVNNISSTEAIFSNKINDFSPSSQITETFTDISKLPEDSSSSFQKETSNISETIENNNLLPTDLKLNNLDNEFLDNVKPGVIQPEINPEVKFNLKNDEISSDCNMCDSPSSVLDEQIKKNWEILSKQIKELVGDSEKAPASTKFISLDQKNIENKMIGESNQKFSFRNNIGPYVDYAFSIEDENEKETSNQPSQNKMIFETSALSDFPK